MLAARDDAKTTPNKPACPDCPGAVISTAPQSDKLSCTTPQCVLKVSDRTQASVQEKSGSVVVTAAILPSISDLDQPEPIQQISPQTLAFYPQRFLRPDSGRAPPTRL